MQQSLFRHMERTEQEKDETIPRRADLAHADGRHTMATGYTTSAAEKEPDLISQGIENIMRFGVERDTKGNSVC